MTRDKSHPPFFLFSSAPLFLSAILLAGCSLDNDALEDAAGRPNSFPPGENALDNFTESSTGDSSISAQLEPNQIRVTLEVPHDLAPEGKETRRNLRIVEPDSLIVYQTDETLRPLAYPSVRIQPEGDNRSIITFNNGLPLGPDVIIEANFGGERIRSLAADSDRDVKINPFSEYLVFNTLNAYSAGEFEQILDCVNDSEGGLCLNKYVWGTLADQVHDFEIDIPDAFNIQGAVGFLGDRADFANYVTSMANYALLGQASSGKISASSADYNTVLWIAELGQTFREASVAGSGQWGVRSAAEDTAENNFGTDYYYPGLTLTSFDVFNIRVTSLASDIPYNRETLIHSATDEFFERNGWEINTHSSSPGAATIEDDGRLLAGRALFQSITGLGSSQTIGWTRNPYYLDAFIGGEVEKPDRVVSGYFTAGKAIELVSENRQLKRERILEDHNLSVVELNLLQSTSTDEGFQIETLEGRDYNVVYLSAKMTECPAPPNTCLTDVMVIESGVGNWALSGQSVTQTLTTSSLRRNDNGYVDSLITGTRTESWLISERPSRVYSVGQGQVQKSLGRLSLDRLDRNTPSNPDEQPQIGIGATTPDGTLIAFNIDPASIGKGILIAAEQTSRSRPDTGRFRLQGVGMAMANESNRLAHFNNSVLTLNSPDSADLRLSQLEVVHDVSAETVSAPAAGGSGSIPLTYSNVIFPGAANSAGAVSFTSANLTLTGFYTDDQDQFYLQVRQTTTDDELLGLVLATRIP